MRRYIKTILAAVPALLLWTGADAQFADKFYNYYGSPVDLRLLLAGNFAEARSDHFHSGIDIKTEGVEGKPLYSVAQGHISRIGVSPTGFGRVLYIAHPNGTTSVYAHMQKFTPEVEEYVNTERYRTKRHRVDLYPEADRFTFGKGELIGYAGNSGSSTGPHLHFEIRDTPSQRVYNIPAMRIYNITDDIPPTIVRLHYIETDTLNGVPLHSRPRTVEVAQRTPGVYTLADTSALGIGPNGYFVLEATDRKNDTSNTMGIYSVEMDMDDQRIFSYRLDSFLFSDTRYVNSWTNYALQKGSRNELLNLAVQENNRLPIYSNVRNRGVIMPVPGKVHDMRIVALDDNGNSSELTFRVKLRPGTKKTAQASSPGIPVEGNRKFTHSRDGLTVSIPAGVLYEPIFYSQAIEERTAAAPEGVKFHSPMYRIHSDKVPLHAAIQIAIDLPDASGIDTGKLCLARLTSDAKGFTHAGGKYERGTVSASVRNFGTYCIVSDNTPPTIVPSFADGTDLRTSRTISFTIRDNFSGVASFNATIDGQWIAFEQQGSVITHHFDQGPVRYNGSTHKLVITATDSVGNTTTLNRTFLK